MKTCKGVLVFDWDHDYENLVEPSAAQKAPQADANQQTFLSRYRFATLAVGALMAAGLASQTEFLTSLGSAFGLGVAAHATAAPTLYLADVALETYAETERLQFARGMRLMTDTELQAFRAITDADITFAATDMVPYFRDALTLIDAELSRRAF